MFRHLLTLTCAAVFGAVTAMPISARAAPLITAEEAALPPQKGAVPNSGRGITRGPKIQVPDAESGVLDQFAVRGLSMAGVAAAKIVAHWLAFGPPLMAAAVIAAGLLGLPGDTLMRVEIGLLIGRASCRERVYGLV